MKGFRDTTKARKQTVSDVRVTCVMENGCSTYKKCTRFQLDACQEDKQVTIAAAWIPPLYHSWFVQTSEETPLSHLHFVTFMMRGDIIWNQSSVHKGMWNL